MHQSFRIKSRFPRHRPQAGYPSVRIGRRHLHAHRKFPLRNATLRCGHGRFVQRRRGWAQIAARCEVIHLELAEGELEWDAGAVRLPRRIDPALLGDFDVTAVDRPAFSALADVSPSKFISAAAQLFEAGADDVAFLAQVDLDVIEKRARTLKILRLPKIVLGQLESLRR
jgi:hypothetical protein